VDAGRPASCPVAIIERGFSPDQRVTFGTLADIADRAASVGVVNPAVVVVGDVVQLSPDFARSC
jgi:uroporphyrin-III C-methyltransferase/precorrin-2 dehydrogenase/sirohydrochlorin ferrochelatase